MSDNKSFVDKLNAFIFGEPMPVLGETDLQSIHNLNDKLDVILTRLDARQVGQEQVDPQHAEQLDISGQSGGHNHQTVDDLTAQVRKLAKTQFKANTLQESQLTQQQEIVATLQKSIDQQEKRFTELARSRQQAIESAQLELINSLLSVVDNLDAAFENGRQQVLKRPMPPETRRAVIAWLDGIRLARMRLLDVLQTYSVTAIPTVGERFDPTRHVAVATDSTGRVPDGIIISEDRRGYATPDKVLRFAEVVVAKSN